MSKTVLLVHAHPERQSLTHQLAATARQALEAQGHRVLESDLYAMGWKAVFDGDDFTARVDRARLSFIPESANAFTTGTQTPDVEGEQQKVLQADAIVFVFPLWWFGFPAILKGWIDRVWAYGLAYGYKDAGNAYRYGDGGLAGKRSMLAVAVGGPEADYSPRGINGPLDELLFPITHGTLFFPGMDVLPTFAVYGSGNLDQARFEAARQAMARRMAGLFTDAPIPFRRQNGGDYTDKHVLAPHVAPGQTGLLAHVATGQPAAAPAPAPALETAKA